jgi:hypothetical protein
MDFAGHRYFFAVGVSLRWALRRAVLCALQGILPVKTLGGGVLGEAERVRPNF